MQYWRSSADGYSGKYDQRYVHYRPITSLPAVDDGHSNPCRFVRVLLASFAPLWGKSCQLLVRISIGKRALFLSDSAGRKYSKYPSMKNGSTAENSRLIRILFTSCPNAFPTIKPFRLTTPVPRSWPVIPLRILVVNFFLCCCCEWSGRGGGGGEGEKGNLITRWRF